MVLNLILGTNVMQIIADCSVKSIFLHFFCKIAILVALKLMYNSVFRISFKEQDYDKK